MVTATTIETALLNYLVGQPTVTAEVSTRIFLDKAPGGVDQPLIVVLPPLTEPGMNAGGSDNLAETSIAISCEAETYRDARDVAQVVYTLFKDGFQGDMSGIAVRAATPRIRGIQSEIVSGDTVGHRSVEVRLDIWHQMS